MHTVFNYNKHLSKDEIFINSENSIITNLFNWETLKKAMTKEIFFFDRSYFIKR